MCWKAMKISMNPGAGMTPSGCVIHQVALLESYLRPDSCLPVLCVPPSLATLSRSVSFFSLQTGLL